MNLRVICNALRYALKKKPSFKCFEVELIKIFETRANYEHYYMARADVHDKKLRRMKWQFKDPGNLKISVIKSALKTAMSDFSVKSYSYRMFEKQLLLLCDGRNNMAKYLGYSCYNKYIEYSETINNVSRLRI